MCTCSEPPMRCEGKWALLKLWGQLGLLEGGVGIIIITDLPISLGMPF